jgi:TolB-like protein/DNA-binding SARP family transcriptional activator
MIRFQALGTLVLLDHSGGEVRTVLTQPKRVALLAYLVAARPQGFHRRDTLLALLWPESDEQRARWALNQALRQLRAAIGSEALPSRGDGEVGIDPSVLMSDVAEFDEAIEAGDHERALACYGGDLLAGFHVPGAAGFAHWLDVEQAWRRRRAVSAAVALAHAEEARNEPAAAGHWARRALAFALDDEGEIRALIALLDRLGDRAGAVDAYERFAQRLRDEFEVDPAPETVALIDAVRARRPPVSPVVERPADTAPVLPPPVLQSPAPPPVLQSPAPPVSSTPTLTPPPSVAPQRRSARAALLGLLVLIATGAIGVVVRQRGAANDPPAAVTEPTTIAVLPFVNLSPNGTDEYFSDGMAEEIMVALSKVKGLRVAARTSAFAFKGKNVAVGDIGRELGVGTVVQGSVRREGDRLRVSVQLVDVRDGFQRWAETYDRHRDAVFAVQEEIATAIVDAFAPRRGMSEAPFVTRSTADLAAYELYLQGRHAWNARTGDALQKAVAYFEQAVARDSAFAQAYAGLAAANVLLPGYSVLTAADAWPKARAAAQRALAIDSTLSSAHTAMAYGTFLFERDFTEAERSFRRAIALTPGDAETHQWYGAVLGGRGDLQGLLREVRTAYALDPLSRQISADVARALWALQRNDEAMAHLQHMLVSHPDFAETHVMMGRVYLQQGRLNDAIAAFDRGVRLRDRDALDLAELAYAYSVAGRRSEAQQLLVELEERARNEYVMPTAFGVVHMALGNEERAFDWLERAAAARDLWLTESIFYPLYNPLRSHPRYANLLRALRVL